jgi:probable HAF family extracellular repeat protein
VVGWSDGGGFTETATRWDLSPLETGGAVVAENLGSLTGMTGGSQAKAASEDGSVVVGWSNDPDGRMLAFRWKEGATNGVASNVQMMDLGTLGGDYASAEAVSRDGRWLVGISSDEDNLDLAFRWSEEAGMEAVSDWLARHGVSTAGYRLELALGISDDGTVVVGQMSDEDGGWFGYLARGVSRLALFGGGDRQCRRVPDLVADERRASPAADADAEPFGRHVRLGDGGFCASRQ